MSASAPAQLVTLASNLAQVYGLDPALVCAVIEQESAWNTWAMRYEPAFFAKYVASLIYKQQGLRDRGVRARNFLGLDTGDGSGLCNRRRELNWGVACLRKKLDSAKGDTGRISTRPSRISHFPLDGTSHKLYYVN